MFPYAVYSLPQGSPANEEGVPAGYDGRTLLPTLFNHSEHYGCPGVAETVEGSCVVYHLMIGDAGKVINKNEETTGSTLGFASHLIDVIMPTDLAEPLPLISRDSISLIISNANRKIALLIVNGLQTDIRRVCPTL